MKPQLLIIFAILLSTNFFAQKNAFQLQNKNQLIQFNSSTILNGYWQCTKSNDSIKIRQIKIPITQIENFLDSLRKAGYQDKAPKTIPQSKYQCNLTLLSYNYYSHDTLTNHAIDTTFVISFNLNFTYTKKNITRSVHKTYLNLYTRYTKANLQKTFATYNNYTLNYFSRSTIYQLNLSFYFAHANYKLGSNQQPGILNRQIHF
jgi:hypothetical protein